MKNRELKKFDILLSLSVFLLALSVAITKVFSLNISLAVFNFTISVVPFIYIIFKSKRIRFYKSNQNFVLFYIIFIRFVTSILSFSSLSNSEILVQVCNDLSLAIILLAFFSIDNSKSEEYEMHYFPKALIISSLIYSIYNILSNLNNFVYFTNIKFRYLISFSSFFNNKNLFGVFIFVALIACDYYLENHSSKNKIFFLIKAFLIINLLLTVSRNAIFAYAIYYLFYNFFNKKYKKILLLLISFFILFLFNFMNIQNFIVNFLIRSDSLTSGRTEIWQKCFEYAFKRPVIGYGELMIENTINSFTGVVSTHNWFIKLFINGGLVNLVCYLLLIVNQLEVSINNIRKKSKYSTVIFSSLIAIIAYGFFEEINLFEFGLINIIFTIYFMFLPKILRGKEA